MKSNFQKILLFIASTGLLLFGFTLVFLYQEINNNDQKTQQDTVSLQTETRRRDDLASLDRALQKITTDRALLESHFIKSSDVVSFFNNVEKLAQAAGVSSQINSVDTKTDNTGLMVELKVSGRFEAIYKFLTLLENSPYTLDFTYMDIHKLPSSAVSGKNIANPGWEVVFKIQLLSFIP